nr:hypothetical protein [Gordonia sp. 852002-10350_SCH5691597]
MTVEGSRVRTVISHVVFGLGVLCLLGGLFAGLVNREAVNSARFAAHVDSIRQDPAVARQLGLLVSGKIISASPELVALRPLVESVSISAVSSPAAGPAVRKLTASIHRSIATGDSNLLCCVSPISGRSPSPRCGRWHSTSLLDSPTTWTSRSPRSARANGTRAFSITSDGFGCWPGCCRYWACC